MSLSDALQNPVETLNVPKNGKRSNNNTIASDDTQLNQNMVNQNMQNSDMKNQNIQNHNSNSNKNQQIELPDLDDELDNIEENQNNDYLDTSNYQSISPN